MQAVSDVQLIVERIRKQPSLVKKVTFDDHAKVFRRRGSPGSGKLGTRITEDSFY